MKGVFAVIGIFSFFILKSQSLEITRPVKFLALGDSYTVGTSVEEAESWPFQFKDEMENFGYNFNEFTVIAQNGWTTGNLLNSLNSSPPSGNFNLVSLLIGVNNQFRGGSIDLYESEFTQLLTKAIEFAGSSKRVFVLSIPDYGYTPYGNRNQTFISRGIDEFNDVNKTITDNYNVKYYNITSLTRQGLENPEYVATDGLHPSGIMYGLWVDLILEDLGLKTSIGDFEDSQQNNGNDIRVSFLNGKIYTSYNNPKKESLNIRLYSILGQEVYSGLLQSENNLPTLESGIYIYRIQSGDRVLTADRIIIP